MRIVFVCQAGELELKAALLATSLRHTLGMEVKITIAIPTPSTLWGELCPAILSLFRALDVETIVVEQPFGLGYPIANKIVGLARLGHSDALLIDTDMLCLAAPTFSDLLRSDVAAKPADGLGFNPGDAGWNAIYCSRDLRPPVRRVLTSVTEELTLPYFNAGLVYAKDALVLGSEWMACCQDIDQDHLIRGKSFHLDQIALPIAIERLGWTFKTLTERWNFPARLRLLSSRDKTVPFFAHYHDVQTILRSAPLIDHVRALLPAHDCLHRFIREHRLGPRFSEAIERYRNVAEARGRDFLITGLPDSGTRQVASMLASRPNSYVTDSPPEIIKGLTAQNFRRRLLVYYAESRRHLVRSEMKTPIGARIACVSSREGTQQPGCDGDKQVPCGAGFLGTTNTLAYLTRIGSLRGREDVVRTIACVRSPHASIRSWKKTQRFMASGDVQSLVSQGEIEGYEIGETDRLNEVARAADVRVRRALLWRYLARIIADNQDWLTIVRYEDLATQPSRVWMKLIAAVGSAPPRAADTADEPELVEPLDREESDIIADVCVQEADVLGYL